MYNLSVMTIVWVSNRNKALNDSSGTFQKSSDVNLMVLDDRKEIVWSTNLSPSVVNRSVVLLNTGNLVLQDDSNNNAYVWESFQHVSDSWLEKMKILTNFSSNEKNILTSWASPDNPVRESFTMTIVPLDIPQSFIWKDDNPYYRTGPWNGECREACLTNCSCIAYSVPPGIGCLYWTHNLTDTHKFTDADFYIRLAHSELDQWKDNRRIIVIAVVFGGNFDHANKLGQGGFGSVYRGKLPNGVEIAVKRLARSSNQGVEEFINEEASAPQSSWMPISLIPINMTFLIGTHTN
ncbi:G-type lectin S-receptor-like serine/threonine-protein kinase [Salvia divinorum]|uniref:G-type lectin S-receptor-like serine/threonine-protein kinase n=1 Tax=Salvia divinorum TaxID=28513 RepID=A0ABD1I1Y9_SALDI